MFDGEMDCGILWMGDTGCACFLWTGTTATFLQPPVLLMHDFSTLGGAVPVLRVVPPKDVGVRAALCKLVPFIKSNNNATVDVSSAAAGALAAWFGVVGSVWRAGVVLEDDGRRGSFFFCFFEDGFVGSFLAEDLMRFSTLFLFSSFEYFSFVFFFFFFEDGFFGSFVVEDAALECDNAVDEDAITKKLSSYSSSLLCCSWCAAVAAAASRVSCWTIFTTSL